MIGVKLRWNFIERCQGLQALTYRHGLCLLDSSFRDNVPRCDFLIFLRSVSGCCGDNFLDNFRSIRNTYLILLNSFYLSSPLLLWCLIVPFTPYLEDSGIPEAPAIPPAREGYSLSWCSRAWLSLLDFFLRRSCSSAPFKSEITICLYPWGTLPCFTLLDGCFYRFMHYKMIIKRAYLNWHRFTILVTTAIFLFLIFIKVIFFGGWCVASACIVSHHDHLVLREQFSFMLKKHALRELPLLRSPMYGINPVRRTTISAVVDIVIVWADYVDKDGAYFGSWHSNSGSTVAWLIAIRSMLAIAVHQLIGYLECLFGNHSCLLRSI